MLQVLLENTSALQILRFGQVDNWHSFYDQNTSKIECIYVIKIDLKESTRIWDITLIGLLKLLNSFVAKRRKMFCFFFFCFNAFLMV